jgi:tetratricopeptide (TPR) repeat protein
MESLGLVLHATSPKNFRRGVAALAWLVLIATSAAPALAHDGLHEKIAIASERIKTAPSSASEFMLRGEYHRLSGEWDAARADYDRAAALDPALPGLDLCRAELSLDRGRPAEARAVLDRLLAREPGEARGWQLRARASEALGRHGEAASDLERAIEFTRDPTPDLYVERSRALVAAGQASDALRCLDEGIARLGSIASLELAAVDLELGRGSASGALARLDRVAAQMERPEKLLMRRAEILAATGDAAGARLAREAAAAAEAAPRGVRAWTPSSGTTIGVPLAQQSPSATAAVPTQSLVDPIVTRGPYLQIGTPTGVTIRWRTDIAAPSRVIYGTSLGSLTSKVEDATLTTEHEISMSGLAPGQRYYYAIGTITSVLEGNDAAHAFVTSPAPGTPKPTRLWIIGDPGTGTSDQAAVRDAFLSYTGSTPTDVWLILGDNAYDSGTDAEYQAKLFNMYKPLLKTNVLWPTRGNHDVVRTGLGNDYYDVFSMPTAGQAGGLASGTEAYYSFDYGNIHFVCLDSEGTDRSTSGAMARWLQSDLAATARDWVIAFWHHPPYTKGSHDSDNTSDSGGRMRDMRANFLPILDSLGVDLVLTGHSHSYERSFLLDRHYGTSTTLTSAMKLDSGDGRVGGGGPYEKPTLGTAPHQGCVYAVAGSSGKISGGSLNHPAMVTSMNLLGSMIVDVSGSRLDAKFIDRAGAVRDGFTMMKGGGGPIPADTTPPAAVSNLSADGSIQLR